ncbi:hypothetical protein PTKIN_Ptkin01aG0086000 [Pterospermum kingtungense]
MRRNCNLELRLLPSAYDRHDMVEESSESPESQQRQLTIFYGGRVCVCDVTELQARAILMLASRETDERIKTPTGLGLGSGSKLEPEPELGSPMVKPQLHTPSTGLSMKRSLQRFLQKRKNRIQATSPYH